MKPDKLTLQFGPSTDDESERYLWKVHSISKRMSRSSINITTILKALEQIIPPFDAFYVDIEFRYTEYDGWSARIPECCRENHAVQKLCRKLHQDSSGNTSLKYNRKNGSRSRWIRLFF